MRSKFCVVLLVTLALFATFHRSVAAPRPTNEELLEKSIADYLRHDTELLKELQQLGFDDAASVADRVKRQSEVEIDTNGADFGDAPKEPGFFDKAAKFMVELLQRFLRWINTENS